jgi:hypothetical protein
MSAARTETGPRARTEALVVKSVGDEMLVYDLARHRALSLNATAAAVWRACDGTRTRAEIGVRAGAGHALHPAVVDYALSRLDRAHLLAGPGPGDAGPSLTRRDLIRRGVAVAAIPAVVSILAPTPSDAASPTPTPSVPTPTPVPQQPTPVPTPTVTPTP